MIKQIFSLLIFSSTLGVSQEYGMVGITNALSKIDSNPTLIKSEFNNLKFTIKDSDKEVLSPSYSDAYLYFRNNQIGIFITNSDVHKEPILLRQIKLINRDNDGQKLSFYSKEGDFVTVDYGRNNIKWVADREKTNATYVFENLSLGSKEEIKQCIEIFYFDKQEVSDKSRSNQNLIGYSEEEVIYKYSQFYDKPLLVTKKLHGISNDEDLILLFKGKEDDEFRNVVVFDKHKICKYIMSYYPNDFLKSLSDNYTEMFGKPDSMEWTERSGNKTYKYFIDLISAENQFIVHMKIVE